MKQYYLHVNNKQEGPFSFDELKNMSINQETLVWYEGAEKWQNAAMVDELKVLFKSLPPPITIVPEKSEALKNVNTKKKTALKKWVFPAIGILLVLIACISIFIYQGNKQEAIQQQLDEQNAIILEQQKMAAQKEVEELRKKEALEKKKREEELVALKYEYDNAITSLRYAKEKLEQVKQFQLLRTPDEKASQIKEQLEIIRNWENEVERINNEINKY